MKSWHRYALGIVLGLGIGGALAWRATGEGFRHGAVQNGIWSTSLSYGTQSGDAFTRAAVARRGLLALPKTETVYWAASLDSTGAALDGACTYHLKGQAIDSRWWSMTIYDAAGYLMANKANIWSISSASIGRENGAAWQVTIGPKAPKSGAWLPSTPGKPFELTLRMYNPGQAFQANMAGAALPVLVKEGCA